MSHNTKYIVVGILSVVSLSAVGLYFYFKKFINKLTFKPTINLGSSELSALLDSLQSTKNRGVGIGLYLNIPIKLIINNANTIGINIKDFFASVRYNGETILRTKAESLVLENINIPANAINHEVKDTVEILINNSSIKFISELIKKSKPIAEVSLKGKFIGFPHKETFNQEF